MGWARDAVELPRTCEQCGGCSTIELGRHLEPAIGVEPITCDNPQLRPIESNERARERLWNCPECYRYTTAECSAEAELNRHYRVHENPQSTAR